jgi:hypothetical protein
MLPSAVNDTMRDMMAQIRDVGDGIRGGTYTMTAPVITGGSITGVALSGNTLTNPVITGGSINNTTVGATTASTGAFTTLSATGNVSFDGGSFVFNEAGADKDARFEGDTDANLLFLDASTDRIGIGTSSPSVKLEVAGGDFRINRGATNSVVTATLETNMSGSSSKNIINFRNAALSGNPMSAIEQFDDGTNVSGTLLFKTNNGGSNSEAMRITGAGNVGIGTSSPNQTGFTAPVLSITNGTSGVLELIGTQASDGTVGQIAWYNTSGTTRTSQILGLRSGANNSGAITFQTSSAGTLAERMRIDSSGNLLVGTTVSPSGSNKIVGKALTQGNQTSDTNQLYRSISSGVFGISPTTQLSQWQSSSAANTFTITLSGRPSGLIVVGVQNSISGAQSAGGVFLAVATDSTTQMTTISETGWATITPSVSGFAITFTLNGGATGHWSATLLGTAVA